MGRKSLTQKEIAKRLGVSIATVSRALNDQPGVGPEVRTRILDTAREMGYSPDLRARSLATSVTHTVGFVVHKTKHAAAEDPFYPIIMAGAEAYLSRHDYHILLTTLDDQTMARPQAFPAVNQRRVDGLILAGPDITAPFILGMITAGVPVVLVDNCLSQTPVNCVLNDDQGGAYIATRHLLRHGHTRVAFFSGPQEWVSSRERARGYQRAMQEAKLEPLILHAAETTIASGAQMMAQALERWPDLAAVFAVNDSVAIGAIRAAAAHGRRTPDELAVIGFDDIRWAAVNEPPLSTVHVFKRRTGELAAQHLLSVIRDPDLPPVKTVVSTELVLRGSCRHVD
jgi:DNA-binding LacI/PurR family transcriptional regulator